MIGELANHLWQSTIFAGTAALLALACRRNEARVRYWLWLAASLKFLVPIALLVALGNQLEWPVCQSAPGASHRRQRLRVGQTGCRTGMPRRGTDRATPQDQDAADARRSPAASLPAALEDRATLCLVPELSANCRAL